MDPTRLKAVLARIDGAAARCGRSAEDVTLVAVSKGRAPGEILALYETGHRHFGENRPDELAAKAEVLPRDIVWHFVGTLQSRKAAVVCDHASLIHSLDREKLVTVLARGAAPRVLLQVNLAGEARKHGVSPAAAPGLLDRAAGAGLSVIGLMTIPPRPERPADSARWFQELARLRESMARDHSALVELSMGMTDDFDVAVEHGATLVRVGRAIFGPSAAG